MIYTTYFGYLDRLPDSVVPIAICGRVPKWYGGLRYGKLAPRKWFYNEYVKNGNTALYTERFKGLVLSDLDPDRVVWKLREMTGSIDADIALVCYERPGEFCHRHLVAEWLREAGYEVEEADDIDDLIGSREYGTVLGLRWSIPTQDGSFSSAVRLFTNSEAEDKYKRGLMSLYPEIRFEQHRFSLYSFAPEPERIQGAKTYADDA